MAHHDAPKKRMLWRWAARLALGAVALVVLPALAGIAYQALASARDARRYPPPGNLIDIGGYRLHIQSAGQGSPTVILDAGWTDCSLNWCLVQPEVAKFTRVCSYDRAGSGWSDPGPAPRTSAQIVRELHTLLANSTHIVPLDQPAAVVDAIRQVITAVREHRPLRAGDR